MTGVGLQNLASADGTAGIEERLALALARTATAVAHNQSLDDEQRSEVYAILQALRADTEIHRQMAAGLGTYIPTRGGDA